MSSDFIVMKKIEYAPNYFAGSDGDVYNRTTGKKLSRRMLRNGYARVYLTLSNGERKDLLLHRVICEAFHGSCGAVKRCVNHIDCDKSNNAPNNLEWVSYQENMNHASANGLLESQSYHIRIVNENRKRRVAAFDLDGNMLLSFASLQDARNAGYSAVSYAIKHNRPSAGMFWKFLSQKEN